MIVHMAGVREGYNCMENILLHVRSRNGFERLPVRYLLWRPEMWQTNTTLSVALDQKVFTILYTYVFWIPDKFVLTIDLYSGNDGKSIEIRATWSTTFFAQILKKQLSQLALN